MLHEEIKRGKDENNDLHNRLFEKAKELAQYSEQTNDKRIFGTATGGGMGSEERQDVQKLIEIMKTDHDVLLQQLEALKLRNDYIEKSSIEKESMFDELRMGCEQAKQKFF
jgi:galactose-1-phosphate uridylyltransferase